MIAETPLLNDGPHARRRSGPLMGPLTWLAGLLAGAVALAVGAVLAVVTAAAVAVIAVVASVLVFFAGLALRARRRVVVPARRRDDVIQATKVGDTWVAYGWERR